MLRAVSHVLLLVGIILVRLPNQFQIKQQELVVPHPIPLLMEASKAESLFWTILKSHLDLPKMTSKIILKSHLAIRMKPS